MSLTITKLTPAVGAEISNVDLARLSGAEFAQIEQAWYRHSALLFRDQKLTDDDLLAFSRRFGELDPPPVQEHGRQSPEGYPDVYVVSNVLDAQGAPIGALGAGEAVWHTDMSYLPLPPDASMLYALEIPPSGGDTWVLGMQAAWTALPAALKGSLFLGDAGIELGFVTQFAFDAEPIVQWTNDMRSRGLRNPIHIGLAGPAKLTTLVQYALRCGVGPSVKALSGRAASFGRLLGQHGPEALVRELARARERGLEIDGIHLFSFGGLARTCKWIRAVEDGRISPDDAGFALEGAS